MNGKKWLQLNRIDNLLISTHAREKMLDSTNYMPSLDMCQEYLDNAQYQTIGEIYKLGFAPNYVGRKLKNIESFYFLFKIEHVDLIAVIQKKVSSRDFDAVWVTTLYHDKESLKRKQRRNPE